MNSADSLRFAVGDKPQYSTEIYVGGDVTALTGYTKAQINAAIANIKASFAQDVGALMQDGNIESNFAVCKLAAQNWSGA